MFGISWRKIWTNVLLLLFLVVVVVVVISVAMYNRVKHVHAGKYAP